MLISNSPVRAKFPDETLGAFLPLVPVDVEGYMGTSLIGHRHPPGTIIGPQAQAYCRVLRGGCFLRARFPCSSAPLGLADYHKGDIFLSSSLLLSSLELSDTKVFEP